MLAVLNTLTDRKDLLTNEIYLLSAVTALQRVTETLPHFISPYLQDITLQVWWWWWWWRRRNWSFWFKLGGYLDSFVCAAVLMARFKLVTTEFMVVCSWSKRNKMFPCDVMMSLSSTILTLPVPAGVSADSAGRVFLLLVFLLLRHRPAVHTPRLPQEHPRHRAAPQGPAAHPHQVLQQHGRRQEGKSERRDGTSVFSLFVHEFDSSVSAQI